MVSLLTRLQSGVHHSLGITFSVFVDNGGQKRRQTSRSAVRAKIQTNCNFKAHVLQSSNLLGTDCRDWFMLHFRLPNRYVLWPYNYTILPNNISGLVHKDFLRPQSSPWGSCTRFIQQQQIQPNAINMARYKKAMYSELWVQLALVGCYSPIGVSGIAIATNNTYPSHLIVTWGVAIVSVYFNSALNPVLYCWRTSEMRQAVKQTISQALCCPLN